ncbi:MAG: hypothetical protein K0R25_1230 [Rickettsiaceae bacterium]|jgi:hypothetical protein|nr:hypothetical protein [Rickettsiaceae bacterium]
MKQLLTGAFLLCLLSRERRPSNKVKSQSNPMSKRPIQFTVYQIIVDDSYSLATSIFDPIKNNDIDTLTFDLGDGKKETLQIKKTVKKYHKNRFVSLYFNIGNKFPYSDKVIDENLNECDNPRPAEQIEPDKQQFVLIDTKTSRIYISDQRAKNDFINWLKKKIEKEIALKSIVNERDFIEKIKSVREISFSVVPDILNSSDQDILSHNLVRDIFGFGAAKAKLQLNYGNIGINDKIKNKIEGILKKRREFKDLVVVGRTDEDLETTFKISEVASKIIVDVIEGDKKLLDPEMVFSSLIKKIQL